MIRIQGKESQSNTDPSEAVSQTGNSWHQQHLERYMVTPHQQDLTSSSPIHQLNILDLVNNYLNLLKYEDSLLQAGMETVSTPDQVSSPPEVDKTEPV